MKFRVVLPLLCLPLCLWAKEDNMVQKADPLLENTATAGATAEMTEADRLIQQELAEIQAEIQAESQAENVPCDSAQAENAGNPPQAGNIAETDIAADSLQGTDENMELAADSAAAEGEEPEMSQEEADAELAAAIDSATADTAIKSLFLDMTAAAIPSASRRISGPYGIRTYRMHRGTDLGLCHGEDRTIVAAFAGKVIKVRNQGRRRGYGKYVILDHGNGLTTLYAHLANWKVKVGDTLQAGDTIGVGGNTGRSFGAHLHFEMRYNGLYIDPATVFDFEQGQYRWERTEIDPIALQQNEDFYQKELSKHRYYKVRRGDCLGKIARKYGISIRRLKQLNGLKSNMIRPGQVLRCS